VWVVAAAAVWGSGCANGVIGSDTGDGTANDGDGGTGAAAQDGAPSAAPPLASIDDQASGDSAPFPWNPTRNEEIAPTVTPVEGPRPSSRAAFCEAMVNRRGVVDVETDYLPHVIQCESGDVSLEALKAQAVAARSYLYYKMDRSGTIADGTSDQVYSCGRQPTANHMLAVSSTAGQVLQYRGTQVAAFFVAGSKQSGPSCRGGPDDPTRTERYVTYNEGRSGNSINQSTLGVVSSSNLANRGCMSQNGAACLASVGRRYGDIIKFYYGSDIELVQTQGPCVRD
jgi:hypothetical protein